MGLFKQMLMAALAALLLLTVSATPTGATAVAAVSAAAPPLGAPPAEAVSPAVVPVEAAHVEEEGADETAAEELDITARDGRRPQREPRRPPREPRRPRRRPRRRRCRRVRVCHVRIVRRRRPCRGRRYTSRTAVEGIDAAPVAAAEVEAGDLEEEEAAPMEGDLDAASRTGRRPRRRPYRCRRVRCVVKRKCRRVRRPRPRHG